MSPAGTAVAREGRVARSWRLSLIAWRLIRTDRTVLSLAVLSAVAGAAGVALVYDLSGLFSAGHRANDGRFALVTLILAYPLTFVSVFLNTAIAAAVSSMLDGRRLPLRAALAVPVRRLTQVALWSLFVAGVGMLIEQIASRLPFIGSIAARLLGLSWSLASMFAVPILATEGCSAPNCLRRSAGLVKKRWGEGLSGNVIITAWTVVAILPVAFVLGIALAALRGEPAARSATLAAMVSVLVLIAGAGAVVRQTFGVVLYRYASTGAAAGGFTSGDLSAPFSSGVLGKSTPSTQARGLPRVSHVRAWVVCGVIAAVLTLTRELTKQHYTAHRLPARIIGGILIWLVLILILRLVGAGLTALIRRRRERA
jgi:hypothetical protein